MGTFFERAHRMAARCDAVGADDSCSPSRRQYKLLGYDVADASWISGLANRGYVSGEIERLARVWPPRLNPFRAASHARGCRRKSHGVRRAGFGPRALLDLRAVAAIDC